jgi:hypothetical protein
VLTQADKLGLTRMRAEEMFDLLDTNKSGTLTITELKLKPKLTLENLAYVVMENRHTAEEKFAQLEKENADLKAKLHKSSLPADATKPRSTDALSPPVRASKPKLPAHGEHSSSSSHPESEFPKSVKSSSRKKQNVEVI